MSLGDAMDGGIEVEPDPEGPQGAFRLLKSMGASPRLGGAKLVIGRAYGPHAEDNARAWAATGEARDALLEAYEFLRHGTPIWPGSEVGNALMRALSKMTGTEHRGHPLPGEFEAW
jgi:hypothetical protein